MLDLSYFQNQTSNVQNFFNGGTWQTWIKPKGAKLVNIICQGSGAGGGGGFQSTTTPRAGGAGGGSGGTSRLTVNASLLPDILYILPGIGGSGGIGGSPATSGSSGQNSYVTLKPDTSSVSNVVLRSGTVASTGGRQGTTAASTGGVGETISLIGNNIFTNLGIFNFQAGATGSNGGTTNGGGRAQDNYVNGGTGGGGTGVGGAFASTGVFPGIASTPVNTNGKDGIILYKPILMLFGGTGGGGSSAAGTNGGDGGDGAPGAGGGGGGASSNTGVNAGNGGRGGDGFVIITTTF
jgi:hypothetical protein